MSPLVGGPVVSVVVVYDMSCPNCSEIARGLPGLLRVPVAVRSCRDPQVAAGYPTLRAAARACGTPAVGTVRAGGTVRWWYGLTGALGLLPLLRPRDATTALRLLRTALRAR